MFKRVLALVSFSVFLYSGVFSQTTEVSLKIGNNGNISFNNKFASGNYTELNRFGNGYQGAVEIKKNLYKYFGIKAEVAYVNSNYEIDHESYMPLESNERKSRRLFYEEIHINNTAFNLSSSGHVNIGSVSMGVGPEISFLVQSVGRGVRYFFSDSLNRNLSHPVQYKFFSKRKQSHNLHNPDETHTYKANRLSYGINANINIRIYRPFSVELKAYFPLNDYIEEITAFDNKSLNQKTINGQVSIVYSFPLQVGKKIRTQRIVSSRKTLK